MGLWRRTYICICTELSAALLDRHLKVPERFCRYIVSSSAHSHLVLYRLFVYHGDDHQRSDNFLFHQFSAG